MLPTVAPRDQTPQRPRATPAFRAAFRSAFLGNMATAWARAAMTKTAPSVRVSAADLADFEFYTPSRSAGSALVIDIDRPEAVLDIFDTVPAEIRPSWVVETRKGAQAGWMIDTVDLRPTARERPIAYARAVGAALRAALSGDEAVDPLTPVRVRNPTYARAELRASATPPVYGLKELHQALKTAGLWPEPTKFIGRSATQKAHRTIAAAIDTGNRNQTVFDVARHVAYAGGDFEAVAWETNEAAPEPLGAGEVRGIIRSITRYMTNPRGHRAAVAVPSQMRELMAEMGRRGGLANTAAQRAARALGPAASAAARRPRTDTKARKAQTLRARGHSQAAIGQKLAASPATVSRWVRRPVNHQCRLSSVEHQVIRRPSQHQSWRPRWFGIACKIPPHGTDLPGASSSGPPNGPRSG